MNHKKILIGLGVFLVLAVVALFVIKAKKATPAANANNNNNNAGTGANPTPATPAATPPKEADRSFPISYLKFSEAAKLLQAKVGMKDDGEIGDKTLLAWNKILSDAGVNQYYDNTFVIKDIAALNNILAQIDAAKNHLPQYGQYPTIAGIFF